MAKGPQKKLAILGSRWPRGPKEVGHLGGQDGQRGPKGSWPSWFLSAAGPRISPDEPIFNFFVAKGRHDRYNRPPWANSPVLAQNRPRTRLDIMLPSPAALVEALRTCNLVDSAQIALATRLATSVADAKALAGELIRRGWLTPFQANLLLQGRDRELIVGAYVLLEKLGEGGMGHVFKARHTQLGRVVAIKLIRKERLANPQAIKRFHREVKVAAQLEHPNVVHALDAGEANGAHYLVMEYVDGIDLARWVKQRGPLPADQACDFIRQAALGLQHAFECGMVHRDIKPANLLVGAAPGGGPSGSGLQRRPALAAATAAPQAPAAAYQIKILDMGLARTIEATDEEETTSLLTREGTVMGT